jgi:hypothetical protein
VDKPADGMNARPIMTLACPPKTFRRCDSNLPAVRGVNCAARQKVAPGYQGPCPPKLPQTVNKVPTKVDVQKSRNRGLFT